MKRLTLRIVVALLTFVFGIAATAAWIAYSQTEPNMVDVAPVPTGPQAAGVANQPTLEMVFVLDTTGSMSGLLDGAKQRIWGIVNDVMKAQARPAVRIGLVAYRDLGDQYVTKVLPITDDLDQVYAELMSYNAHGGGDGPENVRRAMSDAVRQVNWSSPSSNLAQIVFLVGDAPPHDDYANEASTEETVAEAVRRGMIVNAIQCGADSQTTKAWQTIARRGEGQYFAIAQDGGVRSIATPYDDKLSELGRRLGGTFVAYGGGVDGAAGRAVAEERQESTESAMASLAPPAAAAERAVNKALNRMAYVGDLMQDLENGTRKLDEVRREDLPEDLQNLSDAERHQEIEKKLGERRALREQILSLSKQRDEFIAAERKKQTGPQVGFDAAVADALKQQLSRKKIQL